MVIIQLIRMNNIIYMKKISNQIDISILEKAKMLGMITEYLVKYTHAQKLCYACNVVDNILVLGATNSSHLNLMRNYQYDILKDINCEFNGFLKKKIKKIIFKIIRNPII